MWSEAEFEADEVFDESSRELADRLVSEIPDGVQVTRANQDFGGVMFEWRDGQIVPAADQQAIEDLEQAIAGTSGAVSNRRRIYFWLVVAGTVLVIGAVAAVVLYRGRAGRTS
jgi:hypothetical protein